MWQQIVSQLLTKRLQSVEDFCNTGALLWVANGCLEKMEEYWKQVTTVLADLWLWTEGEGGGGRGEGEGGGGGGRGRGEGEGGGGGGRGRGGEGVKWTSRVINEPEGVQRTAQLQTKQRFERYDARHSLLEVETRHC